MNMDRERIKSLQKSSIAFPNVGFQQRTYQGTRAAKDLDVLAFDRRIQNFLLVRLNRDTHVECKSTSTELAWYGIISAAVLAPSSVHPGPSTVEMEDLPLH